MVTLVSAPGLLVFLVARSSFFTWATARIIPLNKKTLNRIGFISDVVPFYREYTTRAATAPAGFTGEISVERRALQVATIRSDFPQGHARGQTGRWWDRAGKS